MADPRFFKCSLPKSLKELEELIQARLIVPDACDLTGDSLISDVSSLKAAKSDHISLFSSIKYKSVLEKSAATVCLTEEKFLRHVPGHMAVLVSEKIQKSYALLVQAFYPDVLTVSDLGYEGVHPSVKLGKDVRLGAYVSIAENAEIGDGTTIGPHTCIGPGTVIGKNCHIQDNVSISYAMIGNGVRIQSGARIGTPGFGFHMDQDGAIPIPQIGRVLIEDMVDIGANTCIDRGSADDTIIGAHTRIDNLVQIAHNVHIGAGNVVVAQVGIAGSTHFGRFCAIGGQAGVAGHLEIGDGVQIAARSGIMRDIDAGQIVGGTPAVPIREWKKQVALLQRMVTEKKSS